jgi:hypothetical protein
VPAQHCVRPDQQPEPAKHVPREPQRVVQALASGPLVRLADDRICRNEYFRLIGTICIPTLNGSNQAASSRGRGWPPPAIQPGGRESRAHAACSPSARRHAAFPAWFRLRLHGVSAPRSSRLRANDAAARRADYRRQLNLRPEAGLLAMSRQTFIFVGTPARDDDLIRLIEQALGASFRHEEGSCPYVRVGRAAVYLDAHEFDDDDIAWPGGSDIPLHSDYPAMLEIRDTGGGQQRQQAIGGQLFRALESASRWPAVYIDDMQKVLASFRPEDDGGDYPAPSGS